MTTFIVQAARHPAGKFTVVAEVRSESAARAWLRRLIDSGPRMTFRAVAVLPGGAEGLPVLAVDLKRFALRRVPRRES